MADGYKEENKKSKVLYKIINTALFAALTMLLTMISAPILPMGGYVHLGDAVIFVSCYFLGWLSVPASVIGSTAADLVVAGGIYYAPATAVIKAVMPLIITALIKLFGLKNRMPGALKLSSAFLIGSVFMQAAYSAYTFILPFLGFNEAFDNPDILSAAFWIAFGLGFAQTAAGLAVGLPLILRLRKIPWVRGYFFGGESLMGVRNLNEE